MVDPLFANMRWTHSNYWRTTVPLAHFRGFGEDLLRQDAADGNDSSELRSLLEAGRIELHIATEGGKRKKPTASQRETFSALLTLGDTVWDEVLDRILADYRLQWPCRHRWWKATYGNAPSAQIIPQAPAPHEFLRLLLPLWIIIMPPLSPKAPAVDIAITFAATWSPNGVAALLRDGHVVDIAAYFSADLQPLATLQHPIFGPLRRVQSDEFPWYGTTRCEPFREFCAIANDRAAYRYDRKKAGKPASQLLADFARGRFTLCVHTAPGSEPSEAQPEALTTFRSDETKYAAAVVEEVFARYNATLDEARVNYEKRLDIMARLPYGSDYLGPVDDVLPKLKTSDGLRELIQLDYIHVHPEPGKGKPTAIGFEFATAINTGFGVLWRDGHIEAAGDYKVAQPPRS